MKMLPAEKRFLGLDDPAADPDRAGCIVLPVPMEETSSWGTGSDKGPEAILEASQQVEFFDAQLARTPWRDCNGIATLAPLHPEGSGETVCRAVHAAALPWVKDGRFVVTLGGEHSSIVGAVRAHVEAYDDLTVLQFDAHSDLREEYLSDPWSHACAMRRVLDFHDHIVQSGIRSTAEDEWEFARETDIPVFQAHAIHEMTSCGEDWIGRIIAATRRRVYVTFDCDVFDPAVMPATGTPEPGGLTWRQVDAFFRRLCAERELVGLDVSELAPIDGMHHPQFTMSKLIYRILGYRFGAG